MPHSISHFALSLCGALLIGALATSPLAAQSASASDESGNAGERSFHTASGEHVDYASPALRLTGMVITLVGITGAVAGGAAMIAGATASAHCDFSLYDSCGEPGLIGGAYTLIGSGVALAIGIPLWVVGGRRVERSGAALLLPRTLSLGPTTASVRWEF